ncbi:hypothetical protein DD829_13870 [Chryseobacterium sp. HMWF035]|nr:hypothetical protein DBR25_05615 [Chryseobacterium sp. HMWF001]PVV55553.1 hypothetical protein DD829_13870 [Chryseobacterium sp. HMWF035]
MTVSFGLEAALRVVWYPSWRLSISGKNVPNICIYGNDARGFTVNFRGMKNGLLSRIIARIAKNESIFEN